MGHHVWCTGKAQSYNLPQLELAHTWLTKTQLAALPGVLVTRAPT
jgi:hypothetical protein